MGNWFGKLDLAYKYTIVFVSLLVLTITAGLIKVFFDRRKLKKISLKIKEEEEQQRDDQVELNQREKDEGDLFGVRAIEAGFYAGIPQSRPTSRAGSFVGSPSMSSSTLLGGANTPKVQSMANSVTDLPLVHTNNRDSDVLPSTATRPAIRLAPSEAEISGRNNHNASVNMSLAVPPSPVLAAHSRDSDYESRSSSRTGARSPVAVSSGSHVKSASASLMLASPDSSRPSSPGQPKAMMQAMPDKDDTSSPYTTYAPVAGSEPSQPTEPTIVLPPSAEESSHQRGLSDTSSIYSDKRNSKHTSMLLPGTGTQNTRESFLAPSSANDPTRDANDPRFSEFYDSYFRTSQLLQDGPKRQERLSTMEPVIDEGEPAHAK